MPVNYKPIPDIQPQLAPTPKVREDFPHVQLSRGVGEALEHIGAGYGVLGGATREVGQALDSLGTQFKGAGNEIFERAIALKQLESDKKVDDLVIAYNQKQSELGEKFRTTEGMNAGPDGLTAHIKQSADLRAGFRNGLTPYEQRKFDSETRGIFGQDASRSVTHSAQQVHHGVLATNTAVISMLQEQIAKATTQEQLDDGHRKLGDALVKQSHLMGWTPEQAEFNTRRDVSKATSMWIDNKADTEPTEAMEILESAHKAGNITEADYDKLKGDIQNKSDIQIARGAADRAMKDPKLTLGEQEDLAKKYTAESTDRPEAAEKAVNNVRRESTIKRQREVDQNRRDTDLLNEWIAGLVLPDGKKPTMEEEAGIDDNVKAAWERQKGQRRKWLKALADNSKEDYVRTPEAVRRFDQLMGMSFDSQNLNKFRDMGADIMSEKIPMSMKLQLLARQREIARKGADAMENPRVNGVINALRENGLLSKETLQDSDTMSVLRGRAHAAINEFETDIKHGVATREEMLKVGMTMLRTIPESGTFAGVPIGKVWDVMRDKVYEQMDNVPAGWIQSLKDKGRYVNDDQAKEEWGKYVFEREYNKFTGRVTPGKGEGPPAPITAKPPAPTPPKVKPPSGGR